MTSSRSQYNQKMADVLATERSRAFGALAETERKIVDCQEENKKALKNEIKECNIRFHQSTDEKLAMVADLFTKGADNPSERIQLDDRSLRSIWANLNTMSTSLDSLDSFWRLQQQELAVEVKKITV